MCLAVPMKIVELKDMEAIVELGGVRRSVSLTLLTEDTLQVGDYVIVHAGFAIQKLDDDDARERLILLKEMLELA
ncbi:MAG TPA: HypC/HybG/HupF family hydrogenase formation chaperone [Candidatus Sumerlaeota bacterium]|nr:MAG: Hydrogenase isoenzymes formation protein HypC [candidate division BRC1 bacterium ADurb.Bin183]HOE63169.1 HypC/HybG/HupF family hydrogenase formation chaperone [Candidatus Sumerlaeota bacterium]HRR32072.1 HypC/HybG/HupF family hydrogenase formation chaperone [Candidatus Sumerlaeia bacterium]HON51518.1 HypC/HybG/HupF family hydrogenase formation chaperone [Candidatus Sumerlaeota bacterium]HOR65244.1 HypC/HybG/HupF family hydrogenase formation chaperone [Candidatus Sumerlaeota bacterium]